MAPWNGNLSYVFSVTKKSIGDQFSQLTSCLLTCLLLTCLLLSTSGEHPDRQHHRLVWKQHCWQPQSSAKGRANCPPHCWRWASLPPGYTRRCTRKARRIIKDSSHPSHSLLSLLPSGRRLRSIRSRTSRLRDSFFPQAIRLMNSQK